MKSQTTRVIAALISVGNGAIEHQFNGLCPSAENGGVARDRGCIACIVLSQAEKMLSNKETTPIVCQLIPGREGLVWDTRLACNSATCEFHNPPADPFGAEAYADTRNRADDTGMLDALKQSSPAAAAFHEWLEAVVLSAISKRTSCPECAGGPYSAPDDDFKHHMKCPQANRREHE